MIRKILYCIFMYPYCNHKPIIHVIYSKYTGQYASLSSQNPSSEYQWFIKSYTSQTLCVLLSQRVSTYSTLLLGAPTVKMNILKQFKHRHWEQDLYVTVTKSHCNSNKITSVFSKRLMKHVL